MKFTVNVMISGVIIVLLTQYELGITFLPSVMEVSLFNYNIEGKI